MSRPLHSKYVAIVTTIVLAALAGCGGNPESETPSITAEITSVNIETNSMSKASANVETLSYSTATMSKSTSCVAHTPVVTQTTVTEQQIAANVKLSNTDYKPAHYGRSEGTWRWQESGAMHVAVYVPPPSNNQEQDYANSVKEAIELTNRKLGGSLILEVTNQPPAANHIQISYNTSYVPPGFTDYKSGNYCANVSTNPKSGNPIVPDWKNNIASTPVYVNVGNGQCKVTADIVAHEFGHALGLAEHFKGFGIGPAISDDYWDTLATLYNNTPSTKVENIIVKRALK
jgi:hypothetical protein